MGEELSQGVTILLARANEGDSGAQEKLYGLVEHELRSIADQKMRRERIGHTLQATVLIDDVMCRLVSAAPEGGWQSRTHFYRAAARGMRRLLIDHERNRVAQRRGGGEYKRASIDLDQIQSREIRCDLLQLDEALTRLAGIDERQAAIVELHHFGGYTTKEVADLLSLSVSTIKLEWRMAKAWLFGELKRE